MATGSPKDTEQKIHRMLNAWQELALDKSFGGLTLAEFEAIVEPAIVARQRIEDLEDQHKQAIAEREAADEVVHVKIQQIVAGVLADPNEGPNSAVYQAFGYTKRSARKSGLTRKRKPPTE